MAREQSPKEFCAEEKRKFLELKRRLHDTARQFQQEVRNRMPIRAEAVDRIVNLIVKDWTKVRPRVRSGKIGFDPFSGAAEVFDPAHWLDVDPGPLHSALVACGEAFERVRVIYNTLSPDEQAELFPDGLEP